MPETVGLLRGASKNNENFFTAIETKKRFRIGRNPNNELVISHRLISSLHCEITTRVDHINDIIIVYLTDYSANGTYLNGSLIGRNRTVVLLTGSIISFATGHLNMVYIEVKNNLHCDENVTVTFQPGSYLYPDRAEDNKIKIISTNKAIGSGGQAEVFLAYDPRRPSKQLACRRIGILKSRTHKTMFETETKILKNNRHVNVLSLVTLTNLKNKVCFFLPLYTGGTLEERINKKRLSEKDSTFIFKQILSGLQYIHSNGIIHCDLKTENILLGNSAHRPRVIISDFGLSMYKSKIYDSWPDSYGTFRNYSPEIFKNEPFDEKVDCWAAGLIFYYMIFGVHPFANTSADVTVSLDAIQESILNDEPDMDYNSISVSASAKNIVLNLLEKDSKKRYSCGQCLDSKWIDWSTQADKTNILRDFRFERYLWFQDEDNPSPKNGRKRKNTGDMVERIKSVRSTKGTNSIVGCKRPLSLDENNISDFFEIIRAEKHPKKNLENFRKVT